MITEFIVAWAGSEYQFSAIALRDRSKQLTGKFQYLAKNIATLETSMVNRAYYMAAYTAWCDQFEPKKLKVNSNKECVSIITVKGLQAFRAPKARTYIVVSSPIVQGSKCIVMLGSDLIDEYDVHGAFHGLKVAKAYQKHLNQ